MAGRKPKPTETHRLNGNPSKISGLDKRAEPQYCEAVLGCPEHLTGAAQDSWVYLEPQLRANGLLNAGSTHAFEQVCYWYGEWRERVAAYENLKAMSRMGNPNDPLGYGVALFPSGAVQQHPLAGMIKTASDMFRSWSTEFGMTPSSITRLATNIEEPDDPLGEFLN